MLASFILILLLGFLGGELFRRLGTPPLLGMIAVGILLGQELTHLLDPIVMTLADDLRTAAVMVILMRAGLGLDREKLLQQGNVALRLGFLPALAEMSAIALFALLLFDLNLWMGLLLGCVISAESPAVIVPGMLRLKSLGWGVTKGIPDVILTGSALSDVLVLLVFSLLLNFLGQGVEANSITLLPFQVLLQIAGGVIIGYAMAWLITLILAKFKFAQNPVHELIIVASLALGLIVFAEAFPYFSGYLATMALGFFLIEFDAPLARRLRVEFNQLWIVAEIVLFVLLGVSLKLSVLASVLLPGLAILVLGLLFGRSIGWYLSTVGSNWTWREKLFLLPGNSAKATVQAAIGAIPLSQGIEGGEIILALAVLSILVTAPLGAWAIPYFAPKLLAKGEVDPTKVTTTGKTRLLAAIDTSPLAREVLKKTGDLARRTNADVTVLHVISHRDEAKTDQLKQLSQKLLADIPYRFTTSNGVVGTEIVETAQFLNVSDIIIGKRGHQSLGDVLIGSVSQTVLESSPIPVILVEENNS
ncbi:MAG: universal stress protein [Cyanobacteria bacterium]|jgi:NhaP-type Na+/H+ or K+/H+ antiporter|nr:universal stress protein [Cyanobacteria bacterium GSL.Bin21]